MHSLSIIQSTCLLLAFSRGVKAVRSDSTLAPRHHEDDSEHSHDHEDEEGGHDHGSDGNNEMDFGDFEFTETDQVWPGCLQDCVHEYMDFLEPVDHPLCVNEDFYNNVTGCIAEGCSNYEQGAYTVLIEEECPDEAESGDITKDTASQALADAGGDASDCSMSEDREITCDNGTAEDSGAGEDFGVTSVPLGRQTLILGSALMAVPLALFLC